MEYVDGLKILLVHYSEKKVLGFTKPNIPFHDLTIALNGKMKYNIAGKSFTLNKGDAIYCPYDVKMRRSNGGVATYFSVNFTLKSKESLPLNHFIPDVLSPENQAYLKLISELLKKPGSYTDSKLECIVKALIISILETKRTDPLTSYAERIKSYIHDNFREDISLEKIAKHVNLHPSYCATLFKQHTGEKILTYITMLRIQHAKELLASSSLKIGYVGGYSGFRDPYYFSHVFTKHCGMSPSAYRRISKFNGNNPNISDNPKEE